MKHIAAISLFLSALSFSPVINIAEAQVALCRVNNTCHLNQKRTRVSNSITVVSSSESPDLCVEWTAEPLPGIFWLQDRVEPNDAETAPVPLTRGDIANAPTRIIVDYEYNGLALHEYRDFGQAKGRGDFIGSIPKTRSEDANGCMTQIDYERVSYDLEANAAGDFIRVTLNRRDDGMIAMRFVEITSGENNELARYVYKRIGTFRGGRLPNARVGEIPPRISFVPSSQTSGVRVRRDRRTRGTQFQTVSQAGFCAVAASDDEDVSEEACNAPTNPFVVTPAGE